MKITRFEQTVLHLLQAGRYEITSATEGDCPNSDGRHDQVGAARDREVILRDLHNVERQIYRITDAIAGGINARSLKDRLISLELERRRVTAELKSLRHRDKSPLDIDAPSSVIDIAELVGGLDDNSPLREATTKAIRGAIAKIVVMPDPRPGIFEIRVICHDRAAEIG